MHTVKIHVILNCKVQQVMRDHALCSNRWIPQENRNIQIVLVSTESFQFYLTSNQSRTTHRGQIAFNIESFQLNNTSISASAGTSCFKL